MKEKEITVQTIFKDMEILRPYIKYFMYNGVDEGESIENNSLEMYHRLVPVWNDTAMLSGLKRLEELVIRGKVFHKVYESQDCVEDVQKAEVGFFHFPAEKAVQKEGAPFIIVIAGGGYLFTGSMMEAFPTAANFNRLGYHVCILNYRVGNSHVLPKPVEDLAAVYQYICNHREELGITNTEYAVCGFSAGAHLACLWGSEIHGYKKYGQKKPKALFPIYVPADNTYRCSMPEDEFLTVMLGEGYTKEDMKKYNIVDILTPQYPPCYLVHGENDNVVPIDSSRQLKAYLDANDISAELEVGADAQHGFGIGTATDVEGWPERAIAFLEALI